MPKVPFNPFARSQESLRASGTYAPAIRQFAAQRTHDRPLLIAGSLLALGLIPVAAYASKRAFGHSSATPEPILPRNQEWYPWE